MSIYVAHRRKKHL